MAMSTDWTSLEAAGAIGRAGQTPVHRQHKRVPSAAGPRLWRALMLIGFVGLIGEAVARSRPQT